MKHALVVHGREIATDAEGYLLDRSLWSEDFAPAQAARRSRATASPGSREPKASTE